jgi:hypothetical protein
MLGAVCATCWGQEPNDVRAVMAKCDAAIASMPKGWTQSDADARRKILGQLFAEPDVLRLYLESIFDPKVDPLLGEPGAADMTDERREALRKVRQYTVLLLSRADSSSYSRTLRRSVLTLPDGKRVGALAFLDEMLRDHRPAVFARVAQADDKDALHDILSAAAWTGDLRMVDALAPHFADKGAQTTRTTLRLRRHMAGQTLLMQSILNSPELRQARSHDATSSLEYALSYLIRAGQTDEAIRAAGDIMQNGSSAVQGSVAEVLARVDAPAARAFVLELLQARHGIAKYAQDCIARRPPSFNAQERMPFFVKFYGNQKNWSHSPAIFAMYLTGHKAPGGLEWARKSLPIMRRKKKDSVFRVLQYLMVMGDEQAKKEMVALAGKDGQYRSAAISALHAAGMPDLLPRDWEKSIRPATLVTLLYDEELREGVDVKTCLYPVLTDEKSSERAALLLLELGDDKGRSFLVKHQATLPTNARVRLAAKMYALGERAQFVEITKEVKTNWLQYGTRLAAIKALATAPAADRAGAARALAAVLLDIDGRVSSAAHKALVTLSGREDVEFSPWATDDIRKAQAAKWTE